MTAERARRWRWHALAAGLACLAACAAAPLPPPEPVIRCHEIPNDLVECVVIEPGQEAPGAGH